MCNVVRRCTSEGERAPWCPVHRTQSGQDRRGGSQPVSGAPANTLTLSGLLRPTWGWPCSSEWDSVRGKRRGVWGEAGVRLRARGCDWAWSDHQWPQPFIFCGTGLECRAACYVCRSGYTEWSEEWDMIIQTTHTQLSTDQDQASKHAHPFHNCLCFLWEFLKFDFNAQSDWLVGLI